MAGITTTAGWWRRATRRPRQEPRAGSDGSRGGGRAVGRVKCLRWRQCHCRRRSQGMLERGVRESVVSTGSQFVISWVVGGAMRCTTARPHCKAVEDDGDGRVPRLLSYEEGVCLRTDNSASLSRSITSPHSSPGLPSFQQQMLTSRLLAHVVGEGDAAGQLGRRLAMVPMTQPPPATPPREWQQTQKCA